MTTSSSSSLLRARRASLDQHHAKMRTHRKGSREEREHLLGPRAGGDIEVLRLAAQQQVAHTSADEIGLMPGGAQFADNLRRRCFSGCIATRASRAY